jgi:gamma-glutamyl phosphate reductase
MGHADGLCTIYLDEAADREKTQRVVLDPKVRAMGECFEVVADGLRAQIDYPAA